jgi:UDP-N-acetylglucosamine 1-carboxyvinyltransferase
LFLPSAEVFSRWVWKGFVMVNQSSDTAARAFVVEGGTPLTGEITVNRAKNSALYLILAALLTAEPVVLRDVPKLRDVLVLLEILEHFGVVVRWQGRDLHLHAHSLTRTDAPYAMVSKMRASFVALGALLGRSGEARISMPGGCAFGPRPVDRHIKAFRQLGAQVQEEGGDFAVWLERPLAGTVTFDAPTVGGTQNVLLASALGSETVIIENAALEPEIADLATMLTGMGAQVRGAGSRRIEVSGVAKLTGIDYQPIPDRIEAGTLMLAAAATRGCITLQRVVPAHLYAVIQTLQTCGVMVRDVNGLAIDANIVNTNIDTNVNTNIDTNVNTNNNVETSLEVDARATLRPVHVRAQVYPGIPTDVQAPFGAFLATVSGASTVNDDVYPDRFTHVAELQRMGANVDLHDDTLDVQGGSLRGTTVHAADIRAGGALVIAALAAEGTSYVTGVSYIERGYEALDSRLQRLGARIALHEPTDAVVMPSVV